MQHDMIKTTPKNQFQVLIGQITRSRKKNLKDAFNGLFFRIFRLKVDFKKKTSISEDKTLVNFIHSQGRPYPSTL
jgi:hypothetical protein